MQGILNIRNTVFSQLWETASPKEGVWPSWGCRACGMVGQGPPSLAECSGAFWLALSLQPAGCVCGLCQWALPSCPAWATLSQEAVAVGAGVQQGPVLPSEAPCGCGLWVLSRVAGEEELACKNSRGITDPTRAPCVDLPRCKKWKSLTGKWQLIGSEIVFLTTWQAFCPRDLCRMSCGNSILVGPRKFSWQNFY